MREWYYFYCNDEMVDFMADYDNVKLWYDQADNDEDFVKGDVISIRTAEEILEEKVL